MPDPAWTHWTGWVGGLGLSALALLFLFAAHGSLDQWPPRRSAASSLLLVSACCGGLGLAAGVLHAQRRVAALRAALAAVVGAAVFFALLGPAERYGPYRCRFLCFGPGVAPGNELYVVALVGPRS